MERDCYQVEVLYYLNPHLIWVEVADESEKDFVFEQIGIYGILPFETTIDVEGERLKAQRCDDWVTASSALMKKTFFEAQQVWFRPTHIDRRTSIFDDNIHKYGEIILKTQDNKLLELSKILMNSGFALFDICLFHQELSLGNLKTKLTHTKTREIIKNLEKDTKPTKKRQAIKKQTAVFQAVNDLGATLTESNLRRHDQSLAAKIDIILEKKSKDFDLCKDVDEMSLGRASRLRSSDNRNETPDNSSSKAPSKVAMLLKKKLELTKSLHTNQNDPLQVLIATKKYLEANAKVQSNTNSNISENTEPNSQEIKQDIYSTEFNNVSQNVETNAWERAKRRMEIDLEKNSAQSNDGSYVMDLNINNLQPKRSPTRRGRKTKKKIPDYDVTTEKRVAFGPPGIDSSCLTLKIVPKTTDRDQGDLVSKVNDDYQDPPKSQEMYADVDSNLEFKITNISVLKEKINAIDATVDAHDISDVSNGTIDNSDKGSTKNDSLNSTKTEESLSNPPMSSKFALVQKKLEMLKNKKFNKSESSITSNSDTTNKDSSSDEVKAKNKRTHIDSDKEEDISDLVEKINLQYEPKSIKSEMEKRKNKVETASLDIKNNVNPFKNVQSLSVFVEKLVSPVLMVHNKMNYPIEPCSNIRDVHFNTHIHVVLKNLGIERPMMLQMVSWPVILRGYSLFMIGPLGSGKTLGYLPAVCRLITDDCRSRFVDSVGPTCIIVCATAQSVSEVEHYARMFLGLDEKVVSCFAGVDELHITTSLLNGCNLFICTPSVLVRLLQLTDFGIDLRRLSTFVLEDCERLADVYASEVKYFLIKIREMLKTRVNKELKVQFVVASRVWCDFMEPLARKTPNSVVCIGAFQECVLYSKANSSVEFIKKENKINKILDFLKDVDARKKTVIVCRSDEEVEGLLKSLTKNRFEVFACNETMTVEDLYNLNKSWEDYEEPLLPPVLVCCDGNLNHMNVTDAHNLIHYSLPHLFSMFCKRFSVLNDNYASIFKEGDGNVRIKVFLEESNTEQLPKILNFVKRCTDQLPEFLDEVCEKVLQEKDMMKAKKLVPLCDNMLTFGVCPDFWNCRERHSVFKEYDEPKEWMPRAGVVTFKILHYHTPVQYSARLLSNTCNGVTKKYPQAYSTLSLKMGMYFSKETNKKLHGTPNVGDICAVSVKQNFFVRCQVLKILTRYNNGTANCVLIKLIDEEKLEKTRDVYLFHLPEELKNIETHIVQVRLANVCPKDKDITFSDLARDMLKKITANDDELYMRGKVVISVGNCLLVDTLEACQELTSLNETVVMHNLKKELLNTHAISNPEHMVKMKKVCKEVIANDPKLPEAVPIKAHKEKLKPQWAHLEGEDMSVVFFASSESPSKFFVRLAKFESCMHLLLKDIAKYVEGDPPSLERVTMGDIVLAKYPDDGVYERALIEDIVKENVVKCFFVDQGDWREVQLKDLVKIPSQFVTQMPFQAIECRLLAVQPVGDEWSEFGINWFSDSCFDDHGDPKMLYVRFFTKEDSEHTGGRKYGVVMIDTNGEKDVLVNQLMIDLNLAQEVDDEVAYFKEIDLLKQTCLNDKVTQDQSSGEDELEELPVIADSVASNSLVPVNTVQDVQYERKVPLESIFMKQPIRSVPLVDSDNESSDSWDIVNPKELVAILKGVNSVNVDRSNNFSSQRKENKTEHEHGIKKNNTDSVQPIDKQVSKKKTDCTKKPLANLPNNKILEIDALEKSDVTLSKRNASMDSTKKQLDSDDLSSTEGSQLSEKPKLSGELPVAFIKEGNAVLLDLNKVDELRKPKLLWRQNKMSVSIKILLIGTDSYDLTLQDRSLKFNAICNDVKYGFEFELYGVVDDMVHSDKGQYILVKFNKIMKKNWLTLTKDSAIRKWIVYDVDSIDTSSDEEDVMPNPLAEVAKELHDREGDTDSDDDFFDDVSYEYKRGF